MSNRAGSGSRSGGSRSSGSRSSSRSSGGHRVSSSSSHRAGSRSYSRNRSNSYGSNYGGSYGGSYRRRSYGTYGGGGSFSSVIAAIVVIIFLISAFSGMSGSSGIPKSTVNREKITGVTWQNDCIVDEIGWFNNVNRASKQLQYFYNKTGIQPYIVLLDYNPELRTEDEKVFYAEQWYDANIDNEGTFLFMYFAEEDVDNDVGYMCYVNGREISTVMDAEAIDIFWAYLDSKWYSDMSTDDLFGYIFEKTADRIMDKSTTGADVMVLLVVGGVVVAVGFIGYKALKAKHTREKEKAEETERILNTPLEKMETDADNLADKYLDS